MAQSATLFVDDQDSAIQFLCPSLKQHVTGSYYRNTWSTVESDTCSKGWFQYTFYGTGIHVATHIAQAGASYSVKIDEGDFIPQSGDGSFDSPQLSDGQHTITYAAQSGKSFPAFDYLSVTAGTNTPLEGKTIAIDDADSSVLYSGDWSTASPVSATFEYSRSLYKNTAHWTSKVGSTLQFQFKGSSISVLGIAAGVSPSANLTASYTLDGVTKSLSLPQGTLDFLPMVELFHADVQPGDHTLLFNLTDISGSQALGIDLITYNASFASLTPPTNAATTSGTVKSTSTSHKNVGAIVGLVIGIILALLLTAVIGVRFWRKHRKAKSSKTTLPLRY